MPHVYDESTQSWVDMYADLPVSPIDDAPVLFIPRRIVRALPWINYDDFLQRDFRAFMNARRKANKAMGSATATPSTKTDVADFTRQDISLVDRYVKSREQQAGEPRPSMEYLDDQAENRAAALTDRLKAAPCGREGARAYQYLVLEIINFLISPELIDGTPEVRRIDGTERRDTSSRTTPTRPSGAMSVQVTIRYSSCLKPRICKMSIWQRLPRPRHTSAADLADSVLSSPAKNPLFL